MHAKTNAANVAVRNATTAIVEKSLIPKGFQADSIYFATGTTSSTSTIKYVHFDMVQCIATGVQIFPLFHSRQFYNPRYLLQDNNGIHVTPLQQDGGNRHQCIHTCMGAVVGETRCEQSYQNGKSCRKHEIKSNAHQRCDPGCPGYGFLPREPKEEVILNKH
jgi:hypothetical protein